jgi:hypothetical protein
MITMRDGIRIPADIYRPKDTSKKYPAIWVRTPYNFNFWDVQNGVPRDMSTILTAVKRGYAWSTCRSAALLRRGQLRHPRCAAHDGEDELNVPDEAVVVEWQGGHDGCSSTAEWQPACVAWSSRLHGDERAGIRRRRGQGWPYYEMGNWYRGGAVQMLFIDWLMGEQNQVRPMFPANCRRRS